MGIINDVGEFMTRLAVISEPLKGLLGRDVACHGQALCGGGIAGIELLV